MVVFKTLKKVNMGDIITHFLIDEQNHVEWMIYPSSFDNKVVLPVYQRDAFSLVQAKLWKDAYDKNFSNGMTMFNSQTARGIRLIKQSVHDTSEKIEIVTILKDEHGNLYRHHVLKEYRSSRLEVWVTFTNKTNAVEKLEFLPSFTLGGISPFYDKQISGNLKLIKIRSKWSMEGRVEQQPIEKYDLEPSWKESGMTMDKIEQHGTMPVRQFFPIIGIYDQRFDVTWMAEVDARASWQLNVSRIGDRLQLFGGLPDRDSGNWFKIIKPNGVYTTPKAYLTVGTGSIEKVCRRLQKREIISDLPIIYNEWATTWGNPDEKLIHDSLKLLKNHQIDTYVIDAGWYESKSEDFNAGMGDWNVDLNKFPNGLSKIVDDIHQQGFKAGIWFEFEGIGNESKMYQKNELQVTRDGWPVTTLKRRFLDLTNLNVKKFLKIKLFDQLKQAKFDYLKVDYNDSIGIGADGADSEAEGIQKQADETVRIFKKLHKDLPNLVIESCSSGGHRLTIPFIENTDLSSFSDAHETKSIPIIAANELNILPAYKNLIWAVLHDDSSKSEMQYRLISTFLGRVCLSGDIRNMNIEQWNVLDDAIKFYQKNKNLIGNGFPFRYGPDILNYNHPIGYQISGFSNQYELENSDQILILIFQFDDAVNEKTSIPLLSKEWEIVDEYGENKINLEHSESNFFVKLSNISYSSKAILLERKLDL